MSRTTDVAVVGASFAGLAFARCAAGRGLRTLVLDRKGEPGAAPHTTGLLVKEVADRRDFPRRLVRKIRGIRLYAPSLRWIDLDAPGYYFLATDVPGLLRHLAAEAEEAGAELSFRAEVRERPAARWVVGADGPRSRVAALCGLGVNREFLAGVEVELDGLRGVDPDRLHVFLDSQLAPGYIGWVVPGLDAAQVGLAARRPAVPRLDLFRRKLSRLFDFGAARETGRRGGLIPVGGPVSPIGRDGALLVGDAAGLVSPLTAGGIHTALGSGVRAAQLLTDHVLDGGPDPVRALERELPRFFWKRLLRRAIDLRPPNRFLDALLASPPLEALARAVFFHHRGLVSPAAWRDVVRSLV
jgi:flavin-dependent dehydrogenase